MTSPARAPRPTPRRAPAARPAPERRPELRVVRPPARRPRTSRYVAAAAVLIFGALLASAVFHSLLVDGQARLDRLDEQVRVERRRLEQDRLDLAVSRSPERIAAEAAALGMVPADTQHWVAPDGDGGPVVTGAGGGSAELATGEPSDAPQGDAP